MTESKAAVATNGQKPRRDPNAVQSRLLGAMRGHEVRIHLLTGETLVGRLLANDTYVLAVSLDGQDKPALVWKHGVGVIDWVDDETPSEQ